MLCPLYGEVFGKFLRCQQPIASCRVLVFSSMMAPEDNTRTPTLMLEVQDTPCEEENMEYPTGFQFLVVLLAMCMSLILTGLVRFLVPEGCIG